MNDWSSRWLPGAVYIGNLSDQTSTQSLRMHHTLAEKPFKFKADDSHTVIILDRDAHIHFWDLAEDRVIRILYGIINQP